MVELSLTDEEYAIYVQVQVRMEEQMTQLSTMTSEQRLTWFREHRYPYPVSFAREIGGTVYTVNAHFAESDAEAPEEKVSRILGKNSPL